VGLCAAADDDVDDDDDVLSPLTIAHSATCSQHVDCRLEHSNSGKKNFDSILATESIFFYSIRQSDKFAACTLIFK